MYHGYPVTQGAPVPTGIPMGAMVPQPYMIQSGVGMRTVTFGLHPLIPQKTTIPLCQTQHSQCLCPLYQAYNVVALLPKEPWAWVLYLAQYLRQVSGLACLAPVTLPTLANRYPHNSYSSHNNLCRRQEPMSDQPPSIKLQAHRAPSNNNPSL